MKKAVVLFIIFILNTYILGGSWYQPNTTYYKLITNNTGICKVSFNDLSAIGLDLMGKDTSAIHLIYCGNEIAYYYNNDELIYCIPRTDILDEYSNDFVVFLYYDEDNLTNYKTFLEAENIIDTLEYIEQNLYLEADKEYFSGYDNLDYDKTRFKGWYWKMLPTYPNMSGADGENTMKNAELIVDNIYVFPKKNSKISIKADITTTMTSGEYYKWFNSKRSIASYFNNDSIRNLTFDGLLENEVFETDILSNWSGANIFRLVNHRVAPLTDSNNLYIGIDKININGYFKPYFYVSKDKQNKQIIYQSNTLNINSIQNNSLITINGLSDSKLYLYDTISNAFMLKDNRPVTHIAVCTRYKTSEQSFLTTILINDNNYRSVEQGIHIAILRPETSVVNTFYQYSYNIAVLNFIRDAPDGSVICIAINDAFGQMDNLKNHLAGQGLTQIMDYNGGGDGYVCGYKKGGNIFIEELNKDTKICCIDTAFYDNEKRWFAVEVGLIEDANYSLVYSDSSNVAVASVSKVNTTNLKDTDIEAELIIIHHNAFKEKSEEYADYKRSKKMSVQCVDVADIYKEFGYGNKSPFAIKEYLQYAYYNWKGTPKYVLFIGDASIDPRFCDTGSISIDYVPTYGYPASDYWFGIFNNNYEYSSDLIVGRIPVSNNTQLENYIEKVKVYESSDFDMWNKKIMFVNGGADDSQINSIENNTKQMATLLVETPLCADTIIFYKTNDSGIIYKHKNDIIRELNSGIAMTIFHGHGSWLGLDNWGWQVDNLYNFNRYGILATLSCNTGDFADSKNPSIVNENFILSYKDRGFVIALGATTSMTISINRELQLWLADALRNGHRRIGDILKDSKSNLPPSNTYYKVALYNFGILGDPTIEIKIDTLTDIYSLSKDIIVTNEYNDIILTDDNTSITIKVPIYNAGIYYSGGFKVQLEYDGKSYTEDRYDIRRTAEVQFTIPLNPTPGQQEILITLDSDNEIQESNKANNIVTKTIRVLEKGLYPVEPLPYLVMNKNNLHFRFLKWQYINNENYVFSILDANENIVCSSTADGISWCNEYVDWNATCGSVFVSTSTYYINVKQYSNNVFVCEKTIPFYISDAINNCDTCAELVFMSANTDLYTSSAEPTNSFLRGDTAFFKIDLSNISLRTSIKDVVLNVYAGDSIFCDTIKTINPDEHILFNITIPTTYLQTGINYISATISAADLYDFNNSFNTILYVNEDIIPPTFKIYIDNALLTGKTMNISAEPYIVVEMYDNSYLPVLIDNPISVRLNGLPLSDINTQHYAQTTINEGKLKAKLEFKTMPLTDKENLFRFIGTDASGNPVDTSYRLMFIINNHILSTFSYPLPSFDTDVSIEYTLDRSEVGGTAILNIYDIEGKHIKEVRNETNSSKGIITWHRDDKNGKKVAPSIYNYILEIEGNNWMSPIFGKIILLK